MDNERKRNGSNTGLFPALLKYWRNQRGMSQIDLACTAMVSSRHISFLETGRSRPSREMVLGLADSMNLPMQAKNDLLRAADFSPAFETSTSSKEWDEPGIQAALQQLLTRNEPYPVFVMDGRFDIIQTNESAKKFLNLICATPTAPGSRPNGYKVFLHPELARSSVCNWPEVAALLVNLLNRKVLQRPDKTDLRALLDEILELPDVNPQWRTMHFDRPATGVFNFRFEADGFSGAFLTTLTTFIAPNNIALEELSIESYYPLDHNTEQACRTHLS